MDPAVIQAVIQGGAVGLAIFALAIVWQQMKVANDQNKATMGVIQSNATANEKVAAALTANTEAVKSLVSIIQIKL